MTFNPLNNLTIITTIFGCRNGVKQIPEDTQLMYFESVKQFDLKVTVNVLLKDLKYIDKLMGWYVGGTELELLDSPKDVIRENKTVEKTFQIAF